MRTASGGLSVSGRLLTVQSVRLTPTTSRAAAESAKGSSGQLSGTITATAYVLPASQGLTAGATPSSPASAAGQGRPRDGNDAEGASSPTAPAVARVTP